MNTAPANAIARAGKQPGRADDRLPDWLLWLVAYRAQILAVFALVAILVGGALYLVGEGAAGQAVWAVAVALLAAELTVDVARTVIVEHRLGVDTIALVAMVGALALGEELAGAVIGLMFSGGASLETIASRRARRELTALIQLAVVRAQVELLDHEADQDKRHEGTLTLLRRLDSLDQLVGDMLTLASAEAGQLIEPQTIDLADFFEDLRRDLPLFGDREFQLHPIDGTLRADPDRLTQVLHNLVRNAVAHTGHGDRITVRARAHDGQLDISVSDTGPGIPPDQLDRIFERASPRRQQPKQEFWGYRSRTRDRPSDHRSPWRTHPR